MPDLDTDLHLAMFRASPARKARILRAGRAAFAELRNRPVYGLEWGDPENVEPLAWVRDHWLRPYVQSDATAVEIGSGGGRWTRYLLACDRVYAVDYHSEILANLRQTVGNTDRLVCIKNSGSDLPGVPQADFIFSFGTFVHLEPEVIDAYLESIRSVLKRDGNVVLHYADKTKPMAQANSGFSNVTPELMREMVRSRGYRILEEDVVTLWHSALIRFGIGG